MNVKKYSVYDFARKIPSEKRKWIFKWEVIDIDLLKKIIEEANFSVRGAEKLIEGLESRALRSMLLKNNLNHLMRTRKNLAQKDNLKEKDLYGYKLTKEYEYLELNDGTKIKRRIKEHRLVMEKFLNRKLVKGEVIHHINLDKADNRLTNLLLCNQSTHIKMHQNLERLAGRLIEAGLIAFCPETYEYLFVGQNPKDQINLNQNEFVRIVDFMGNDTNIVNAARVSFGKTISQIRDQDKSLLDYLSKNKHTSPFRHVMVQFHIKAPEFVARQWYKHIIGSDYTFKDTAWNEISGRYVEYDLEPWLPKKLRKQSDNKKQGSDLISIDNEKEALEVYQNATENAFNTYKKLLEMGVCKEQARTILGLNFYTEWYWTASLQAIGNFVLLRDNDHAQLEIREYAIIVNDLMKSLFPNAWESFIKYNKSS